MRLQRGHHHMMQKTSFHLFFGYASTRREGGCKNALSTWCG